MARKASGGFNKLLNFIGLVDDEDNRDTYGEEYSGDNYGRQAAYSPSRQQRRADTRVPQRQSTARRLPEPAPRASRDDSRYPARSPRETARASRGYDDYRALTTPGTTAIPAARRASRPATTSRTAATAATCRSAPRPSACASARAAAR